MQMSLLLSATKKEEKKTCCSKYTTLYFLVSLKCQPEKTNTVLCICLTGKDFGCNGVTGLHQPNDYILQSLIEKQNENNYYYFFFLLKIGLIYIYIVM